MREQINNNINTKILNPLGIKVRGQIADEMIRKIGVTNSTGMVHIWWSVDREIRGIIGKNKYLNYEAVR